MKMEIDRRMCGRWQAEPVDPMGGRGTGDSIVKDGGSSLLLISGIIKYFESGAHSLLAVLDGLLLAPPRDADGARAGLFISL